MSMSSSSARGCPGSPPATTSATRARAMRSSSRAARSAGRGTCSAIPASARTRTCSRSATGSAPGKRAKASPDGPSILSYVKDTAREYGIDRHIRFHHRVVRAEWSSAEQRWTVEAERTDTGETVHLTAGFLFGCTGYYRYDEGYTPQLPGSERFRGTIVHPQHWPEDLDYSGKRVVVIGSGATAVTLVPAMAGDAEHVTMLQRSPSYVVSMPNEDPVAKLIRRVLPARLAHPAVRWKNVLLMMGSFQLSRRAPKLMRRLMRAGVRKALPAGYDVDTHF